MTRSRVNYPLVLDHAPHPVGGLDKAIERIISGDDWPTDLAAVVNELRAVRSLLYDAYEEDTGLAVWHQPENAALVDQLREQHEREMDFLDPEERRQAP